MITTTQELRAGMLVKMVGGEAVFCDGNGGGWIIVGEGSDQMYHTQFYNNDYTFTNKAGLIQYNFDWIFDARSSSIQEMINIATNPKLIQKYHKVYLLWDRVTVFEKLDKMLGDK